MRVITACLFITLCACGALKAPASLKAAKSKPARAAEVAPTAAAPAAPAVPTAGGVELSEDGKMAASSLEQSLKDCPPEKDPATLEVDARERYLDSCRQRVKGARNSYERVPATDRQHPRVATAYRRLRELEKHYPVWQAQFDKEQADKASNDDAVSKAYWDYNRAYRDHQLFVGTLVELEKGDLDDFALSNNTEPKAMLGLIEAGKQAEVALAGCSSGKWKPILGKKDKRSKELSPGEVCATIKTWRATVAKFVAFAFDRQKQRALETMSEWGEKLKTTGEAWDDTIAALSQPAAWAATQYEPWKATFAALEQPAPADFTADVTTAAKGTSLASVAKTSRFTAKHADGLSEGAAKAAAQAVGLKVLKTRSVVPAWVVESDGGRPVFRQRYVQVLAQKPGEAFCRVYPVAVKQEFNDLRNAYAPPVAEITPAMSFFVSACK